MDVSTAAASSFFGFDEPICPYTGLRTFTEDEAIYFRGRESHIAKCLALLVEQRFVMITGASGDGKSSLVFAGMLPEVRAGFVPARYSRWAVATFRPERSPLRNLAEALTTALRLPSSRSVETELSRGFASLVQLYQTSELCQLAMPTEDLTPAQRQQQRQAANLLLVVDQFEEFFTNPENYDGDQPSTSAQTVVNLLLETARLAQAENLPIYIVCTMRSDFVGQCAEFRGLIEQVGASQYFVPRLLRHEFLEVIKGPALLSGNRISERLVQRLLYDIGQGQDQLPVLQHALRRIWLAADQGREEMDLIHYAMVGGLSDALPPEDQARFEAWRAKLPAHQEQFLLANPGLRNVLDAHANQLYFEANDLYNQDFQPPLPPGTAEQVIEQTFRVLTRTDGKRVVRNRVTGAQITAILNDAALPWPVVCRILRPFRAEGTTFLRPFLSEDEDGRAVLPPDAVLDISHESLIRNWNHLTEWARKEAEDVQIASDFKQQAGLWKEKSENRGYLLAIGLYRRFSEWHTNKKGADSWLTYYQSTNPDASLGQGPVATQIGLLTRYLAASRRHLWSELLAARYGVWRLSAIILLPIILLFGGMWWWSHRIQQSDYVAGALVESGRVELSNYAQQMRYRAKERDRADSLLKQGNKLLELSKTKKDSAAAGRLIAQATKVLQKTAAVLPVKDMARFILNTDRLKKDVYRPLFGTRTAEDYAFPQMLATLKDDTLALDTELSMYALADNMKYDRIEKENPYIRPILNDLIVRLAHAGAIVHAVDNPGARFSERQRRLAVFTARTIMALSYYLACDTQVQARVVPDAAGHQAARKEFAATRKLLLVKLRDYVRQEIDTKTGTAPSPVAFGFCLRVLLAQGSDKASGLAFLNGLSPFDPNSIEQYNRFFPSELGLYAQMPESHTKFIPNSGGYLTAAMAFAALGKQAQVLRCLDMLHSEQLVQSSYRNDYSHQDSEKINSCMALVPYLIKYELLDASSSHALLAKCAQASQLPFNELYAAAVNSLLSVKPLPAVFDVSQDATSQLSSESRTLIMDIPARIGGVSLEYLNQDRVSFSLPVSTRDKAWVALKGANAEIANQETMFSGRKKDVNATTAYFAKCNALFLDAFWAKTHGVYLIEIKHLPGEAEHSFAQFSRSLQALQLHLRGDSTTAKIPHAVGTIQSSIHPRSAIAFLQLPLRPELLAVDNLQSQAHYTCSFDAFCLYELRYQARQAKPDWNTIQLLDELVFTESRRGQSSWGLMEPFTNLGLIKAITKINIPGNTFREQRNRLFLEIEEAIQIRSRDTLRGSVAARSVAYHLLKSNQQLSKLNDESMRQKALLEESKGATSPSNSRNFDGIDFYNASFNVAMDNALYALALETARSGHITDALALADSISATTTYALSEMKYAHRIRIAEQAMLTNSQHVQPALDNFLSEYLLKVQAGVMPTGADESENINPSASSLAVCFWRPFIAKDQLDTIPIIARSLTYRLNKVPLTIGLKAPFKAFGLANDVYEANEELKKSPFVLGFSRFVLVNQTLLGYAHFLASGRDSGWHEYDEEELTLPADYMSFGE